MYKKFSRFFLLPVSAIALLAASQFSAANPDSSTTESPALSPLPERDGAQIQTSGVVPHIQIDVMPNPALTNELIRLSFLLPGVEKRQTIASRRGTHGMWLSEGVSLLRPEAIVAGREFAHIHPDGSLHAPLPYERAVEVAQKGWGQRHPWADEVFGWEGLVMIFSPLSEDQLDTVFQLVVESYNYVTGRSLQVTDIEP